jgi:hypothetical protein
MQYQYMNKYYPSGWYNYDTLGSILRDHKIMDIYAEGEMKVRSSFDAFLDFSSKLEYLKSIGLMSENELNYFRYFIDKAASSTAVIYYVRIYNFPLYGELDTRLNCRA